MSDVIQADREAAAECIRHGVSHPAIADILSGEKDAWFFVQAFARHRIATQPTAPAIVGDEETGLLPCPFCGAAPIADGNESEYVIRCEDCDVQPMALNNTREDTTPIWNTRAAIAAIRPEGMVTMGDAERAAVEWFGQKRNLELYFYTPIYGDDDDLAEEWRVDRVSGSINDREWTTIGRGATPIAAMLSASKAEGE